MKSTQSKLCLFTAASALGILLACCSMASAQSGLFSVNSTTDGNGLFSYTFNLANPSYVLEGQAIWLQSHGILDVISPPGWNASIDANEMITGTVPSGVVYVGDPPLTFSVQSSFTGSVLYDQAAWSGDTYAEGVVGGGVYTLPDHINTGIGGFEEFSFLGPEVVPEPSGLAILAFGTLVIGTTRRVLSRRSL